MNHKIAMSRTKPENVDVLGIPVTCFASYQDAVEHIVHRIKATEKLCCVAINPMKVCSALANASFAAVVKKADIHICDGVGAAMAARLLHGRSVPRITGVQLFLDLLVAAEGGGLRVFLLGADPESNELAYKNLLQRHPKLDVVGRHHGYFDSDAAIVDAINLANPDILFVAMGSPKQEYWMARYRDRLAAPFMMGLGGTFDVLSGKVRWAPRCFRRTGTEFLYRFCMQPRRFRNMVPLSKFAFAVLREHASLRLAGKDLRE